MTVSIRVMTAGDGYRYLLNSVVTGDGDRDAVAALTRYYLEAGTPPGVWLGTGLPGLAGGIKAGTSVGEAQLRRLMGHGTYKTGSAHSSSSVQLQKNSSKKPPKG